MKKKEADQVVSEMEPLGYDHVQPVYATLNNGTRTWLVSCVSPVDEKLHVFRYTSEWDNVKQKHHAEVTQ